MHLPILAVLPTLPVTDPVLIVALAMGIFLVVPLLFERIRIPGIIGLIVVGAAVGPNGIGLLARDATIILLGTVGLLYLMLMVGLELDLNEFNRYRNRSIVFGTLSFLVPAVLGAAMGLALGYSLLSSLLLGSAFASHTLLAYPIVSRLGIVRNAAVTTTLGGTILTEILALVLLAVVANAAGAGLRPALVVQLAVPFAIYVAGILWGLPKLGRWFFRNVGNEAAPEFVFVMASLFAVSYLAHAAGVEPIVGALLAGLALNRLIPPQGPLMNRIHFVGDALFIPFFLLSVGMLVDVRALDSPRAWGISVALALGVTFSKWAASWVASRVFRYTAAEGWVVFGLSVPHAAGTLAIVLVGYEVGLLDQAEVNGVVLMILVTCLVGPWVTERFGREVALGEERKPYDPSDAPRRILIPLANPATADALLDLAFIVRGSGTEPIHPLMVVPDAGEATEAQVAEAEKTLAHAVLYAAGAEVPVVPLARVDRNVAAGIVRGIAETRSSVVILGWDGRRSGAPRIFGTVLDRLLEQSRQLVMVVKLGHPLNTTRRVVLVLPPAVERQPGFLEALRTVKTVAGGIGAPVLALHVDGDRERLEEAYGSVSPRVPTTWEPVDGWEELRPALESRLGNDDLVVVMSAREGTLPWNPRLARLPTHLATLVPQSFIMVYPPETEPAVDGAAPVRNGGLTPRRVVELERLPLRAAVRRMAEAEFRDPASVARVLAALPDGGPDLATEILPGVIVPHARLPGLPEPILLLGVSPEGIELAAGRPPARLVFLLLSAVERPAEHLRCLAEIARTVSSPERISELMDRHAPDTPLDWLHVPER
jgi:Kef-type K+ transport system membrane component KefB/mannitol/fructose-specific phosphotransferase system IIA component (Ntr-type)/nucleotide-binding universal stress UspA family protein